MTENTSRAEIIEALVKRDGGDCYLCETDLEDDVTIDHVIPQSRGGSWELFNLKLAHFKCNQEKADRLFLDDGTLEPRSNRPPKMRKADRPDLCTQCDNGRRLSRGAFCEACGTLAGPQYFPRWAKVDPRHCRHDHTSWCWYCASGLADRRSPYIT